MEVADKLINLESFNSSTPQNNFIVLEPLFLDICILDRDFHFLISTSEKDWPCNGKTAAIQTGILLN